MSTSTSASMRTVLFCIPLLLLLGCMHSPQAVEEPGIDIQGFVDFFEEYEALCPYFAHKEIDWKEMGLVYYPLIAACENQDQLAEVLIEMLAVLEDPAIYLWGLGDFSKSERVYPYTCEYDSNYDMDVLIEQYLEPNGWAGWEEGYCHGFGWCDPAILPYAFLDTIPAVDDTTAAADSLDAFIAECIELEVPAIILDIRMNPFSVPDLLTGACGHYFMGRFAEKAYPGAIYRSRSGPEYDQYEDVRPVVYPRGPLQYTGTVILLVGENCRSMSENMTANFINFPNVVLVGDTTGGSVSILSNIKIADFGFTKVVQTTVLTYLKHWIEGAGIPPDIYVEATESDFASGKDPVLDHAIDMLGESR